MTVKELKEKLNEFDDHLMVMIPCENPDNTKYFPFTSAKNVTQGVNELDGAIVIDDYEEDD
jgi:hypothetical protein